MATEDGVYITLVTSDAYAVGACVLAKSLRESGTTHAVWCLAGSLGPSSRLSSATVQLLWRVFEGNVIEVEPLDSADARNLALLGRPELGPTFTKLRLWQLTQFRKLVYLDADTLVLKNIDELFERDAFSAAPDAGWPDCFNSGVFVAEPRTDTYAALMDLARNEGSFDGGDQGILNTYFSNWNRMPFVFNMTINSSYSYAPAFAHYRSQVRVVHFIGTSKPWTLQRNSDGSVMTGQALHETSIVFHNAWWTVYDRLNAETSLGRASFGAESNGESFNSGQGTACQQASYARSLSPQASLDFANYRVKWSEDVESYFRNKPCAHPHCSSPTTSRLPFLRKQDELSRNHCSSGCQGRFAFPHTRQHSPESEEDLDPRHYDDCQE